MGYGAGLVLLIQRDFWKRCLAPLEAVGRLALDQLLTANSDLHDAFLRLRSRSVRKVWSGCSNVIGDSNLSVPGGTQFVMDPSLPVWPSGMAMEKPDVWPASADADHLEPLMLLKATKDKRPRGRGSKVFLLPNSDPLDLLFALAPMPEPK